MDLNKIKFILLGILILCLVIGAGIMGYRLGHRNPPEPKTIIKTITVNPTPAEKQKADLVYTDNRQGEISGQADLVPADPEQLADTLRNGLSVPVTGQGKVTYTSGGQPVGEGLYPINGMTTFKLNPEDNTLKVDTSFNSSSEVAVDTFVKPPDPLMNEVGYYYLNDHYVYYKRYLINSRITASMGPVYNITKNEFLLSAGASFKF
jgi:hypothetical protein